MIKKIISILFVLITSLNIASAENFQHKVIKVIDGDTVYIDFNNNGIPEQNEKVRINGIDTFETKLNDSLNWQMKLYNLTQDEALGLGYYGKEFTKKALLNKPVKAEYTAKEKFDKNNRHLMSIYYNCNKNGKCKNYEQEVLKAGLATIYTKSNLANELKQYGNLDKIKQNAKRTHKLNLVVLNKKNGKYHKTSCEYAFLASQQELINKPLIKYTPTSCCIISKASQYHKKKYLVIPDYRSKNLSLFYIDGYKYKRPSTKPRTKAAKVLIKEIQNAKESIYFAIYGIAEQPDIEKALINAKKRGVDVKGVVDMTQDNKNIYSGTEKFIERIGNIHNDYEIADKNVKDDFDKEFDITAAIMHNKFFVFDQKKVFTGSTNISNSGIGGYNTNVNILINSPEIAILYTKEFKQMYDLKFHTIKKELKNNKNIQIDNDTKVSVFFAPKNKVFANELHHLLKSAQKTIYIEMFYLTNKYLVNDLISAKQKGVEVKVILDASSANNEFSAHNKLRSAGISVKIENWGGKMHTKAAIIDNEYYVIGSMNWTGKAELHNDENLLIIQNSALVKNATKHFNHLWDIIPDKYLIETPKAEGIDSKYSCFDGMDNDHDGKVDCYDNDCLDCCRAKRIK